MRRAQEDVEPLTPAQVAAADDLAFSNTARAWGSREIDVTAIERSARDFRGPSEVIPAVFVAVVSAVCAALREVPMLNSRWTDGGIRVFKNIDVGIELPTGRGGRVVPVVRDADRLSLDELGSALLAAARRGLSEEGTFTVGYSGAYGSTQSRPLLHDGQAGIYHFGRVRQMPRIAGDAITVRSVAYGSLAFDHRILDGSTSSRFQNLVKTRLESWAPENPGS